MSKNVNHIQHLKSSVVQTVSGVTTPKLPLPGDLIEGELAINYAAGYETISIKNSSGNVVTFSSDEKIFDIIADDEEVTAYALTDLDTRLSGLTEDLASHEADSTVHLTQSFTQSVANKMTISGVGTNMIGDYAITADVNTYYRFDSSNIDRIEITLPIVGQSYNGKVVEVKSFFKFADAARSATIDYVLPLGTIGVSIWYCRDNPSTAAGVAYTSTATFDGSNWIIRIDALTNL